MLSASHNPMPDNGIKFLARGGLKLDDAIEDAIERRLREDVGAARPAPTSAGSSRTTEAVDDYVAHLSATIDHPLVGLKVVLDCAEGAASEPARARCASAGAEVVRHPRDRPTG